MKHFRLNNSVVRLRANIDKLDALVRKVTDGDTPKVSREIETNVTAGSFSLATTLEHCPVQLDELSERMLKAIEELDSVLF